jgi:hypothetical protein
MDIRVRVVAYLRTIYTRYGQVRVRLQFYIYTGVGWLCLQTWVRNGRKQIYLQNKLKRGTLQNIRTALRMQIWWVTSARTDCRQAL